MSLSRLAMLGGSFLLGPMLLGQSPLYTFDNAGGIAKLGLPVRFVGDIDGDGRSDVYLGSGGSSYYQIRSGKTGLLIRQVRQVYSGYEACGLGDVDGDGHGDYIVTSPGASGGGVSLHSGKTGLVLWTRTTSLPLKLGYSCARIDDLDADKIADVMVTARGSRNGELHILSGKTGKGIRGHGSNPVLYEEFAWAAAVLGDIDADGVSDYIVGAPLIRSATLYSGKTGKLIRMHSSAAINYFGRNVRRMGDLDADGVSDYLIAGAQVHLYSGKTGQLIQSLPATGGDYADLGDLDGDGVSDILRGAGGGMWALQILSGKTLKVIFEIKNPGGGRGGFGVFGLAAGQDVNGDGKPDFLYTMIYPNVTPWQSVLMSGADLDYHADVHEISATAGGSAQLTLGAGKAFGSRLYIVLGTVSGTSPGIPLGNQITLPLQPDPWFWATLGGPNAAPLTNSLGFTDLSGGGQARFTLPANLYPFLKGLQFHHAYAVFSKDYKSIVHASRPVPLRIH